MAVLMVNMKIYLLILIFYWLLSVSVTKAQQLPLSSSRSSNSDDCQFMRCADRSAVLDIIAQQTPEDELIIVVARLGSSETRPNLNRRRLHNVRAYWTEFLSKKYRRKPETIILAEGERMNGCGQLEFYIGGKLFQAIAVARNSDVDFGDCYPPDDSYIRNRVYNPCWVKSHRIFYPCRDRNVRRKGRR